MEQLRSDIGNKNADTAYKQGLLRYEPWKVLAGGLAAGAALMAALASLAGFRLPASNPPPPPQPQQFIFQPGSIVVSPQALAPTKQ